MARRVVVYDENNKVIRDGPERASDRYSSKYQMPLDLRPADIIHWGTLLIISVTFVVTTRERIETFEKSISYLTAFAQASDGFHSAVFRTQFNGGRPIDGGFNGGKPMREENRQGGNNERF